MKATSDQAMKTARAIDSKQGGRLARLSTLVNMTVVAALALGMAAESGHAQNAAQRKALAQLRARPQVVPPNGVEATNIAARLPGGVAFDAAGNLFIADTGDHIVLKVNLAGIVSTVAGTGEQGFSGDGAAATSAQLDSPQGVAVDSNGNIYIADTHNNRIREIVGGVINTIAGTGAAGFSGDGGAATAAMLDHPSAVAVDSNGNVYIADTNNHRIREIAAGNISTVVGNGDQDYSGDGLAATAAGLDSPSGIAVDAAFNLYIGDTHNQRVRMVTASSGHISTLAGTGAEGFTADGPATAAALAQPRGIALDGTGSIYVADSNNNRVRAITGTSIATVAGNGEQGFSGDNGPATAATLDTPHSVATFGTSLAIADTNNNRVREVAGDIINTITGQPGAGSESLTITGPLTTVYGSGTLTATFSNGGNIATGSVEFDDVAGASQTIVATVPFASNAAQVSTSTLSAGQHFIVASYIGDANNSPITSGVYGLAITPLQLTAVANTINMLYGQSVPALTGTLTGVLAQDVGKVNPAFATTATMTSPVGTYPIGVVLSGTASTNYTVVLGPTSGSVVIAQAPTLTTLVSSSLSPTFGTPVTLTATVASTTSGTPTGTVSFFNGSTLLNTAALTAGVATLTTSALPIGAQSITATYSGDTNFLASSTASAVTVTVLQPEFSISASPASRAVFPGGTASYTLTLTPSNATFVNAVSLSVSGLPPGATASFTPASIAAGSASSTSMLAIATSQHAQLKNVPGRSAIPLTLALLMLPLAFTRRARRCAAQLSRAGKVLLAVLFFAAFGALSGCGGSGFFPPPAKSYTVTVTAVSGTITHTTAVTLTVR